MRRASETILLLLLGGIAFGYSVTPGQKRRVAREFSRLFAGSDNKEVTKGIAYLYRVGLVGKEKSKNGLINLALTRKGKERALSMQLNKIKNKKEKWDGKWRMVAFDIPEKYKNGRDALSQKLKKVGFCELQKSVLITPFECKKEIEFLTEFFELKKYVRFGVLESIDNENYFKKIFKLN